MLAFYIVQLYYGQAGSFWQGYRSEQRNDSYTSLAIGEAMIGPVLRGVGVYLIWNGLWMMMMGFDKHQARRGKWRVRERTLFAGAFCWGALGVWVGMIYFRHKTKHLSFKLGIPVLLIVNWISLVYIMRGWR